MPRKEIGGWLGPQSRRSSDNADALLRDQGRVITVLVPKRTSLLRFDMLVFGLVGLSQYAFPCASKWTGTGNGEHSR